MNYPDFYFKNVADRATGYFDPIGLEDHRRMHRTMAWCYVYCQGKWRRSIYAGDGRIVFEFESVSDADALRRASGRVPSLIACR